MGLAGTTFVAMSPQHERGEVTQGQSRKGNYHSARSVTRYCLWGCSGAAVATHELRHSVFNMMRVSIVGPECHTDDLLVGYHNAGESVKRGGEQGSLGAALGPAPRLAMLLSPREPPKGCSMRVGGASRGALSLENAMRPTLAPALGRPIPPSSPPQANRT